MLQALAEIDGTIAEMERLLADTRRQLDGAHGPPNAALTIALRSLEEKLSETTSRRKWLVDHQRHVERTREINAELGAINRELEQLHARGDRGPRFEEFVTEGGCCPPNLKSAATEGTSFAIEVWRLPPT